MNFVFDLIENYGIYIIFIVIFLEYSCFPLPSEVILPLTGAISYSYNVNPFVMILLSVVAGLGGAMLCYCLGYFGTKPFLKHQKEEKESVSFYERYGNMAVFVGRLIPLCRTYISFVAGFKKHKPLNYLLFTTLGIFIWNTILILLGYFFYDNIDIIGTWYIKYKYFIIAIIILFVVLFILKKMKKRRITPHKTN